MSDIDNLTHENFDVEIDQVKGGPFVKVQGLGFETQDLPGAQGNRQTRNTAGVSNARDLRLTRRFTGDKSLFQWAEAVKNSGEAKNRRNGTIRLKDAEGKQVSQIEFYGAWAKAWYPPELDKEATSNTLLKEIVVLSIDDFKWV